MAHDKKDLLVFLRHWKSPVTPPADPHRLLTECFCKEPSALSLSRVKPGSAERHQKAELALSFQNSHQTSLVRANLCSMPSSLLPPSPSWQQVPHSGRATHINNSSGRKVFYMHRDELTPFPHQHWHCNTPGHAAFVGSVRAMSRVRYYIRNQ